MNVKWEVIHDDDNESIRLMVPAERVMSHTPTPTEGTLYEVSIPIHVYAGAYWSMIRNMMK